MNSRSASSVLPVITRKHVFTFGKHKGQSVDTVLSTDPSYIIWLRELKVLNIPDDLYDEACDADQEEDDWVTGYGWDG